MKKGLLKTVSYLFVCTLCLLPFIKVNALDVSDETSLVNAIANGGDITLTNDIEINSYLIANRETTINGNGFAIVNINEENGSGNRSIITSSSDLTLINVTLKNATKYGVQSYRGNVTLDGVTIENSGFGAALINGGTLVIKDLTMKNNAYGIEFAKGVNVDSTPSLIMNGKINATEQINPLYVDETQVSEVVIDNDSSSAQKASLKDNVIVIKEGSTVVAKTSELQDGLAVIIDGDTEETKAPVEPEEPTTPEEPAEVITTTQVAEKNPNTADNAGLYLVLALIGLGVAGVTTRSLIKHH